MVQAIITGSSGPLVIQRGFVAIVVLVAAIAVLKGIVSTAVESIARDIVEVTPAAALSL